MAKIWQKMKKSLSFTPKKNFGYPPTTSRPLPIHHLVYTFNDFKANFVLVGTYLPICAKDRVDLGSSKIWTKKKLENPALLSLQSWRNVAEGIISKVLFLSYFTLSFIHKYLGCTPTPPLLVRCRTFKNKLVF